MSVRMLLNSMDSRELSEWAAFFTLENEDKDKKPSADVATDIKKAFGRR
jgi:hypothetical protein